MKSDNMRGFSLIELMTVIAIVGALLSIAAISMAGYINRTKLKTAILAVEADIRLARWTAKGTGYACLIRFRDTYRCSVSYRWNRDPGRHCGNHRPTQALAFSGRHTVGCNVRLAMKTAHYVIHYLP